MHVTWMDEDGTERTRSFPNVDECLAFLETLRAQGVKMYWVDNQLLPRTPGDTSA